MKGVKTKKPKQKIKNKQIESNWILSMLISSESTLLPDITLCFENAKSILMKIINLTPIDNIISYQVKILN